MESNDIICWWSGGVTSAVATKIAIDLFGIDRCKIIMIDTKNEDDDTYRFLKDCEIWYNKEITTISAIPNNFDNIQDVWRKYNSLNVSYGAICSLHLKRKVREAWETQNNYTNQVFGFEFNKREFNRALAMKRNNPNANPIFPLIMMGMDKNDCIELLNKYHIEIPNAYKLGFRNNNCLKTGCVQGGVGYWQKMKREFPDTFERMANIEHELTNKKGKPVCMLKDQTDYAKENKSTKDRLVFLKKHKDYPDFKTIDDMPIENVKPLTDCNGFCGTNDLIDTKEIEKQLNLEFL